MKRIDSIHLKNFKAFRDQVFEFGGKNVLIYGNNGSGKSSLFWAIYTFFQSSGKTDDQLDEYFVHFNPHEERTFRSLKNMFASETEESSITLTWIDEYGVKGTSLISNTVKNTNKPGDTTIREADLGSDFINYKLLHNFYNASHKAETNLWEVFLRDIFPYFKPIYDSTNDFRKLIETLSKDVPRTGTATNKAIKGKIRVNYESQLANLNTGIEAFLNNVQEEANRFLSTHFGHKKPKIEIELSYLNRLNYWSIKNQRSAPKICLTIKVWNETIANWVEIKRPQSFLNEASLTRVAVAVRLGALLSRESMLEFQVLCLDDMLLSLDMSNRNEVVEIILNKNHNAERFDHVQKIILTHDRAFFNLIKRETNPLDWKYFELRRDEESTNPPKLRPSESDWERAAEYLDAGQLEECALFLRREIESVCKTALRIDIPRDSTSITDKEFLTLSELLNNVRNRLNDASELKMKNLLRKGKALSLYLDKLETSFETDTSLTPAQINRLKSFRRAIVEAAKEQQEIEGDIKGLINDLKTDIDFVLNATAHSTVQPLYEGELRRAFANVHKFRDYFENTP